MSRSVSKPIISNKSFLKKVELQDRIVVFDKSLKIKLSHVGKFFNIHNGNRFKTKKVELQHVGYRFGEFVLTREKAVFKGKKKKK